jgi:hypothetical protein
MTAFRGMVEQRGREGAEKERAAEARGYERTEGAKTRCANCGWEHSATAPAKNAAGQVLCSAFSLAK